MKREATREQTRELIASLKTQASLNKSAVWKRVAFELERPRRNRRVVNFSKINSFAKEGETLLIPGKLLAGGGKLEKKVNIIAFDFSESALKKLSESGSKIQTIEQALKSNPKGKKIRIFG